MLEQLKSLKPKEVETFFAEYLPKLAKSIKVDISITTPKAFVNAKGWGASRGTTPWERRVRGWEGSGTIWYDVNSREFRKSNGHVSYNIPIFPSMAAPILGELQSDPTLDHENINSSQETKEMSTIKNTTDKVIDTNKQAMQIATQLTTGKAANRFFIGKLLGKMPWYAKLFGKKKEIQNNAIAKFATAQLVNGLVTHFGSKSKKLQYVSEAMVQDAMVDITVNSKILETLLDELEESITLPDLSEIIDE